MSLGPGIPECTEPLPPANPSRHKLPHDYTVRSKAVLGGLHREYSLKKKAA